MSRVYSRITNIEILVVYRIGNEHLAIMRLVWMIEADDDVHIGSKALFDGLEKISYILSWVKDIHRISLVDEYDSLFFIQIETDIAYMILYELSRIFVPYFLQEELDIFIHREID